MNLPLSILLKTCDVDHTFIMKGILVLRTDLRGPGPPLYVQIAKKIRIFSNKKVTGPYVPLTHTANIMQSYLV